MLFLICISLNEEIRFNRNFFDFEFGILILSGIVE